MVFKKLAFCVFGPRGYWTRIKVSFFFEAINVTESEPTNPCTNANNSRLEDRNDEGLNAHDEGGEKICCVCLSRLKERGDIRSLACSHEFHRECVDRWLKNIRRKTCPVCRFLVEDGGEKTMRREVLTDEMMVWFSSFHAAGF